MAETKCVYWDGWPSEANYHSPVVRERVRGPLVAMPRGNDDLADVELCETETVCVSCLRLLALIER